MIVQKKIPFLELQSLNFFEVDVLVRRDGDELLVAFYNGLLTESRGSSESIISILLDKLAQTSHLSRSVAGADQSKVFHLVYKLVYKHRGSREIFLKHSRFPFTENIRIIRGISSKYKREVFDIY